MKKKLFAIHFSREVLERTCIHVYAKDRRAAAAEAKKVLRKGDDRIDWEPEEFTSEQMLDIEEVEDAAPRVR